MIEKKVLTVGWDESGNGKSEIVCLATFSEFIQDARPEKFKRKKDPKLLKRLKSQKRDYRFSLLDRELFLERFNKKPPFLYVSYVLPQLINDFIRESCFKKINIYIDGEVRAKDKHFIKQQLTTNAINITCQDFPKQIFTEEKPDNKNSIRYYNQPSIIALADIKANSIYRIYGPNNFLGIEDSKKFVKLKL